jgi:hypothetical protein
VGAQQLAAWACVHAPGVKILVGGGASARWVRRSFCVGRDPGGAPQALAAPDSRQDLHPLRQAAPRVVVHGLASLPRLSALVAWRSSPRTNWTFTEPGHVASLARRVPGAHQVWASRAGDAVLGHGPATGGASRPKCRRRSNADIRREVPCGFGANGWRGRHNEAVGESRRSGCVSGTCPWSAGYCFGAQDERAMRIWPGRSHLVRICAVGPRQAFDLGCGCCSVVGLQGVVGRRGVCAFDGMGAVRAGAQPYLGPRPCRAAGRRHDG